MPAESIEAEILFHVGFHKTGTTWMQRRVFVPKRDFLPAMSHAEVRDLITGPNRLLYDPEPARSHIAKTQSSRSSATEAQVVISSELMCGNPFSGNRELVDFAHRIQEIGLPTKILITVREQVSMIVATYAQYIKRGGTFSLDTFLGRAPHGFERFDTSVLQYDQVLRLYQGLFGGDRVCLVPHEAIVSNRLEEMNRLRSFCNLEPWSQLDSELEALHNSTAPEWSLSANRRLNRLRRTSATPNPAINLGRATRILSRAVEITRPPTRWGDREPASSARNQVGRRFSDEFRDSNRRLQELVGTRYSLIELGYQG